MLDYKNIIIKHYALSLSGSEIARQLGASKSGVNDFLRAFDKCESLSYPLPPGITNYGIAELVYGSVPGSGGRNENIEYPNYEADAKLMATRKNMTLVFFSYGTDTLKNALKKESGFISIDSTANSTTNGAKRIMRLPTLMP